MVYPVKMHVRYSTVLVIVLLLMGSVLYEVTRTESLGRQSAARTQDIALPAPQPVVHTVRAYNTNFIGSGSSSRSAIQTIQPDQEFVATAAYSSTAAASAPFFQRDFAPRGGGVSFSGGRSFNGRSRSSGGSGFAAGSYGMGGVGAWGGVSGVMRPTAPNLADRPARRVAAATRPATPAPRRSGNGSGGGATSGGSSSGGTASGGVSGSLAANVAPGLGFDGNSLPGGFTTGAASVEPGAVVNVSAGGTVAPKGPAPAPTPEPMSMLLVGTGLAALYKVRQHLL